jgi:glutamate-1-semialdehyde 2,1-aminomutase
MTSIKEKLHQLIPGGAHTYSRGDDQFPENAPAILDRGEGCFVYDDHNNRFLDYGMGLRSVNIGYGHKEIADAAYREILKGNNLTRASLTELHAADLLREMVPSADMVKFAKHGSTVTTAAVKLARAYTGRKYIAIPAEHPFFSFDDWFIGSTVLQRGIPEEHTSLTVKFNFNDLKSLEDLFIKHQGQIAAVMLEPATTVAPMEIAGKTDGNKPRTFLHAVQDLCKKNGSVFILDEMITGFRWALNGAQNYYDIMPDLSTFGKAMANGFAVAALTGKKEIMSIGGIREEGAERVFLASTTHGAEMSALGAFIKTVEIIKRDNVIDHLWKYGQNLINGMNSIAKEYGIEKKFYVEGAGCSPNYITKDKDNNPSFAFRTLFSQEMVNRGILMPYVALSFAHSETELDMTLTAVKEALLIYKQALEGDISKLLHSRVIKPVFRKYN